MAENRSGAQRIGTSGNEMLDDLLALTAGVDPGTRALTAIEDDNNAEMDDETIARILGTAEGMDGLVEE